MEPEQDEKDFGGIDDVAAYLGVTSADINNFIRLHVFVRDIHFKKIGHKKIFYFPAVKKAMMPATYNQRPKRPGHKITAVS